MSNAARPSLSATIMAIAYVAEIVMQITEQPFDGYPIGTD